MRSKRFGIALAAALAATAGFAATGGAFAKDSLTLGVGLEPPHLDPTAGAAAAIDEIVYANLFEGLTRIDRNGAVQPGLAESWTISDDRLTYTFTLRDGVTFHDGAAFDSSDVKFSLDRARAEDSTNAQMGLFAGIASVEAPDPGTVIVTLKQPEGNFLWNLGWGDAIMVDPASAESNKTNPVGTGPFKLARWTKGDSVMLTRQDQYWGDAPALKTVTFKFIPDASAQVAALLAGDVDAMPNMGAPETLAQFDADPRFEVVVGTTEGETLLVMNQRRDLFKDPKVRRAIAHAIDKQAIIDGAMFGFGTPIGSHFAPHNPAYLDLTGTAPYDPEKAKSLLAEAGHASGLKLVMKLPPPSYARRGGEIIAAQLRAVGIETELVNVEWGQWLSDVFKGDHDFDFTIVSHTEPLDIGIYTRPDYYFGYQSDAFNAVMGEIRDTADEEIRKKLYQKAQTILAEDTANVFLFQLAKTGVRSAKLDGMWENAPIQANDVTGVYWRQ